MSWVCGHVSEVGRGKGMNLGDNDVDGRSLALKHTRCQDELPVIQTINAPGWQFYGLSYKVRTHDQVHQTGFILQRDEQMPIGRRRRLWCRCGR